jgi:hypothetical protein
MLKKFYYIIVGMRRRTTAHGHRHVLCFFVSVFRQQRINQLVKLSINWFQGLDKVVFGEWLGEENSHRHAGIFQQPERGALHEPKPWFLL